MSLAAVPVVGNRKAWSAAAAAAICIGTGALVVAVVLWASGDRVATSAQTAPSAADVQVAFDRAARIANGLYDKDLKIVGADCRPVIGARFLCQVSFVKPETDPARAFLDNAIVERAAKGWSLLRGLCHHVI